jgi:hypothetical protein
MATDTRRPSHQLRASAGKRVSSFDRITLSRSLSSDPAVATTSVARFPPARLAVMTYLRRRGRRDATAADWQLVSVDCVTALSLHQPLNPPGPDGPLVRSNATVAFERVYRAGWRGDRGLRPLQRRSQTLADLTVDTLGQDHLLRRHRPGQGHRVCLGVRSQARSGCS